MNCEELAENIKCKLESILKEYHGKKLRLMISGGSVAEILAKCDISGVDSSEWNLFFSDERYSLENRNFIHAREFISHITGPVHPINVECDKKDSAPSYVETLRCFLNKETSIIIDVCLLGVGSDGHICSLWPGSPALNTEELATFVNVEKTKIPERITVTSKFLNNHVNRLFFVIPPKNGKIQEQNEPHDEIKAVLTKEYTMIV